MARTYHDHPRFQYEAPYRWSPGLGRFMKRQLSKARRRMWKQGRSYSFAHYSRECNWKAW